MVDWAGILFVLGWGLMIGILVGFIAIYFKNKRLGKKGEESLKNKNKEQQDINKKEDIKKDKKEDIKKDNTHLSEPIDPGNKVGEASSLNEVVIDPSPPSNKEDGNK